MLAPARGISSPTKRPPLTGHHNHPPLTGTRASSPPRRAARGGGGRSPRPATRQTPARAPFGGGVFRGGRSGGLGTRKTRARGPFWGGGVRVERRGQVGRQGANRRTQGPDPLPYPPSQHRREHGRGSSRKPQSPPVELGHRAHAKGPAGGGESGVRGRQAGVTSDDHRALVLAEQVRVLVGRLVGWSVGWLVGWLVGWVGGWVGGSLGGWVVGFLVGWLVGWMVGGGGTESRVGRGWSTKVWGSPGPTSPRRPLPTALPARALQRLQGAHRVVVGVRAPG